MGWDFSLSNRYMLPRRPDEGSFMISLFDMEYVHDTRLGISPDVKEGRYRWEDSVRHPTCHDVPTGIELRGNDMNRNKGMCG